MDALQDAVVRSIARIEEKTHSGPDTQVDDRYVVFAPTRPDLTDPFLLLSEDWFSSPGFEWHPHRGVETVTLVVDGVLEHGDNAGHVGALSAGDVQWMTAGRGIIHRELAFRNERAHTLQLWVNLPGEMKMVDTRYQDVLAARRPVIEGEGTRVDLVSGEAGGVRGPALNNWPISGAVITLEPNRRLDHLLPGRDRAFLHVLSGTVTIAGRSVRAGQTAWSDPLPHAPASTIRLETGDGGEHSVVMVYSGEPIGQSVVMGGPFVMNSRAEIEQAFRDFHRGDFGRIPHQARLQYR
ncbi:pirin family protein [Streptomyces sp. NBC_01549]|uniref:pirin family protein n=1 Tax=unclassified Streptomyces TaxID=2593676 RepID=UPI002254222D|nr:MULTISPECIES: pirin family protein [unclassified Streptomyces]MCX4406022.1 pirin family protein [Streptomyces sp. NBC_01764]MCX4588219.1 pirin family protein [Streptomyces sp. NBC_01549]MCX5189454.1 pirin family protein [Streptomyces sp. NBC_00268]